MERTSDPAQQQPGPPKVSDPLKVALVIPVHNRRETTLQALRSLSRIDRSGIAVRIFVVDDGSSDGTSEAIAKLFRDVTIVKGDGTLHYAGGTNLGIEAAAEWEPDHFLLMNDVPVFHGSFFVGVVETAEKNPRSVVGALLLLWDAPHKVFQVGQVWRTFRDGWQIPDDLTAFNVPKEAFTVECLVGNCTLVPAAAVKECGVLDAANFPMGWGDAQYFMRLRKAGWTLLIEPRAYVWCEPNTYPAPLHEQGIRRVFSVLFLDQRHPSNFKRQFQARWHSAPNRGAAVAAFSVYILKIVGKSLSFGLRKLFRVGGRQR
ncbi:MAG TPA: glycosyltransferase family 2 protein [Pyrinomonadaceae bacterium]|nr:glycosyltransferase family 2 protein [Pyrinomonadaceae bacterium]